MRPRHDRPSASAADHSRRQRRVVLASFAVLGALKATLIAAYGPLIHPDTSGYLDYAGLVLDGGAWLHAVDLETLAKPPEVLRPLGYPALIAAAKVLGGAGSAYFVIGL